MLVLGGRRHVMRGEKGKFRQGTCNSGISELEVIL
jgi:hypothetical protein